MIAEDYIRIHTFLFDFLTLAVPVGYEAVSAVHTSPEETTNSRTSSHASPAGGTLG